MNPHQRCLQAKVKYMRNNIVLKDKYPNFEVGLKCIIMVFLIGRASLAQLFKIKLD